VPVGTAIAIAPEAVVSGYDGDAEVDVADSPTLHFDDSVPAEIVSAAGAVASPSRSTFQHDVLAIRLRVKCAWAAIQPGSVQYATGIKW
jgi:hypothetical protein